MKLSRLIDAYKNMLHYMERIIKVAAPKKIIYNIKFAILDIPFI